MTSHPDRRSWTWAVACASAAVAVGFVGEPQPFALFAAVFGGLTAFVILMRGFRS